MNQSELIEKVARAAELNQAAAGQAVKAVVNAIQLAELLGDDRHRAPADLARRYPMEMAGLKTDRPVQPWLFAA